MMLRTFLTLLILAIAIARPVFSDICNILDIVQYDISPSTDTKFKLAVHHLSILNPIRTNTFTLFGDIPFRGFLLYVLDRDGNIVGKFTSYDESEFMEYACSEETKGRKIVSHRELNVKYPPYQFEWNDDKITDTVTVQGMVVVSETEYYNINPISFRPVPRSQILIPRQLTSPYTPTGNSSVSSNSSAANSSSTTSSAATSASSAASTNGTDSSGDSSDGSDSTDDGSGTDPGFLGFGSGTPKGQRPIKDNLLFTIYMACCVILYFVGNALETRLKAQDKEIKARQAKIRASRNASATTLAQTGNSAKVSTRNSTRNLHDTADIVEMDDLDIYTEPYKTQTETNISSAAPRPYMPALVSNNQYNSSAFAGPSTSRSPTPGGYSGATTPSEYYYAT